jgi:hypothetical protein
MLYSLLCKMIVYEELRMNAYNKTGLIIHHPDDGGSTHL